MNDAQARGALEAILFVAGEAVQLEDLARALEMTVLECDGFIDRMAQQYLAEQRGVEIIRIEDKVQFRTSRQYAEQVQAALKPLFLHNCQSVARVGTAAALTGPVERADEKTILKHLNVLPPEEKEIYIRLSEVLTDIAKRKHPERDYSSLSPIFERNGEVR